MGVDPRVGGSLLPSEKRRQGVRQKFILWDGRAGATGIVEAAGNATMLDMYEAAQARQYLSIVRDRVVLSEHREEVVDEHHRLVDLAAAADWVTFARELSTHYSLHEGVDDLLKGR